MADVVILEPNQGSLEKYKNMLHGLEQKYTIWYTSFPEQAMEWISEKEVAVVITEDEMGIINASEFSDMYRLSHPNLVHVLMTEVIDINLILEILNEANIFEIILKPFKLAEDLILPIERGMKEYERRKLANGLVGSIHGSATNLAEEFDKLRSENFKRGRDYTNLYAVFSGIVHGNLKTWGEQKGLKEEEYIRVKYFVQEIVREYINGYVFSQKEFSERKKAVEDAFFNEANKSSLIIQKNVKADIPQTKVQDIFFFIFLMAHLCKFILARYQLVANVDQAEGCYVIRFQCDPSYSALNGKMVYAEQNPLIRGLMHEVVEVCLKKVFVKSMKGYNENPFVAVATTVITD
ncbi:MAG: response regulator [Lachnospiraceae bacterium]|jgi:FixJ family two-component response regulator|nr:response regulator [Lachnospiraceae bacterium]